MTYDQRRPWQPTSLYCWNSECFVHLRPTAGISRMESIVASLHIPPIPLIRTVHARQMVHCTLLCKVLCCGKWLLNISTRNEWF